MTGLPVPVGVMLTQVGLSAADVFSLAGQAEKLGADSVWLSHLPNQRDAGVLLAAVAARTERVKLGSAVQPVYSASPVAAAQAAMTLDEISGGRSILGLGAGHRMVGEWMLGGRYSASAASMREYLTVVNSLIRDGQADFTGTSYSAHMSYSPPRRPGLPVYLGTAAPRMLEVAGELADGVLVFLSTPAYIRDVVVPHLRAGRARRAGPREPLRIRALLPVILTSEPDRARAAIRAMLLAYAKMENYRRLLHANGWQPESGRPLANGEFGVFGDAGQIAAGLSAYRDAGATEFLITPMSVDGDDLDTLASTLTAIIG